MSASDQGTEQGYFRVPRGLLVKLAKQLSRTELLIVVQLMEFEGRWTTLEVEDVGQCSTAEGALALANLERRGMIASQSGPNGVEYAVDARGFK